MRCSEPSRTSWVLSKSAAEGQYDQPVLYFRRLYDLPQAADSHGVEVLPTGNPPMNTDANGVASFVYKTTETAGSHTLRVEFAGDPWVDAGFGEATLTLY